MKKSIVIFLLVFSVIFSAVFSVKAAEQPNRPNVHFIMVDEMHGGARGSATERSPYQTPINGKQNEPIKINVNKSTFIPIPPL